MSRTLFLTVLAILLSFPLFSQNVKQYTIADSLDTPWDMNMGPDGWVWFTERPGDVSKVDPETGQTQLIASIDEVRESSEGGLLGMALHPNFKDTAWVFVAYNYRNTNNQYKVKVVRFNYLDDDLENPKPIIEGIEGNNIHDGCRLVISPARKLFITTGDAGNGSLSQDNQSPNGKVLLLNLDGSIPANNPINGNPMWSKGHRNAQGLTLANGTLYSSEHGPQTDDEFNIIHKGRNYGWPAVKGYCDESSEQSFCQDSNVVEPLKVWEDTEAVCGIDYYGSNYIPEWKHSIFVTTLGFSPSDGRTLYQLELSNDGKAVTGTKQLFANEYGRLRDVLVDPNGKIYLATSNRDGRGEPENRDDRIIMIDKATSGKPHGPQDGLQIKPNPFQTTTTITFNAKWEKVELTLVNSDGQTIWQESLRNIRQYTIGRNGIAKGTYFLKISTPNKATNRVEKLVIK